jgi:hypothetical protein
MPGLSTSHSFRQALLLAPPCILQITGSFYCLHLYPVSNLLNPYGFLYFSGFYTLLSIIFCQNRLSPSPTSGQLVLFFTAFTNLRKSRYRLPGFSLPVRLLHLAFRSGPASFFTLPCQFQYFN